jgi:hypothetical protein
MIQNSPAENSQSDQLILRFEVFKSNDDERDVPIPILRSRKSHIRTQSDIPTEMSIPFGHAALFEWNKKTLLCHVTSTIDE